MSNSKNKVYTPVSPKHYQTNGLSFTEDVLSTLMTPEEFAGFLRGNTLKYIWRYKEKGGKQDLQKAAWYLNKLIEVTE